MGAAGMADLTRLGSTGGPHVREAQRRALTARAKVAIAPGAPTDPMVVTIKTTSGILGVTIPPGNWAPRVDTDLPAVGNVCCITYDDQGDAWVGSNWSPYASA